MKKLLAILLLLLSINSLGQRTMFGGQNNPSNSWGSFAYCLGAGYNSRAFQGKIAVVLFYDRVLTAAEQLQNFNALKSRFGL